METERPVVELLPQIPQMQYKFNRPQTNPLEAYKNVVKIGEGTFGKVYKADFEDPETGEVKKVALKKFNQMGDKDGFPITSLREIKYLRKLQHPNIVHLKDVVSTKPSKSNKGRSSCYLVFDYLKHDLSALVDRKVQFSMQQWKSVMHQILSAVEHLHKDHIVHRDIKGANILISDKGVAQLADFGLANRLQTQDANKVFTNKVVTLWYRAPELLLAIPQYSETMDMWSVGCVFAEMFIGKVLFQAQDETSQMFKIMQLCGIPTEESWPDCSKWKNYAELVKKPLDDLRNNGKDLPRFTLAQHLQKESQDKISGQLLDLILRMLTLNNKKRITAKEALQHEFFKPSPQDLQNLPPGIKDPFDPSLLIPALPEKDEHELDLRVEKRKQREKAGHKEGDKKTGKEYVTFQNVPLEDCFWYRDEHKQFSEQQQQPLREQQQKQYASPGGYKPDYMREGGQRSKEDMNQRERSRERERRPNDRPSAPQNQKERYNQGFDRRDDRRDRDKNRYYDSRDQRDARDPRDMRDHRDNRDARDMRDQRDHRDQRGRRSPPREFNRQRDRRDNYRGPPHQFRDKRNSSPPKEFYYKPRSPPREGGFSRPENRRSQDRSRRRSRSRDKVRK